MQASLVQGPTVGAAALANAELVSGRADDGCVASVNELAVGSAQYAEEVARSRAVGSTASGHVGQGYRRAGERLAAGAVERRIAHDPDAGAHRSSTSGP